ncbi:PK beta-barrel-protein domain-containing protein-like protein [Microthyrium microscopicum]|uniref:PK beta-barrel-protein domain-containing protein-like protein n=1 Tax=Microthyrium microscopicum TaxID=703497 RepID=A0A6A6U154_9PEZI|nr:PK beta-barrel-protein domain-containing protein-like protein [Microthyrium microscopicum]
MATSDQSSDQSSETSKSSTLSIHHGTLREIRTGRIKPAFNLPNPTAIFKTPVSGPIKVGPLGLQGDQQSFKDHGGIEKALLQYCSAHYEDWEREIPESKSLIGPGGFGENLVCDAVDETSVCVGDVVRIGRTVLVAVTEPRQPCYMLNHRFKCKDMSLRAQESGRTGWLYRVLREGYIEAGDEMVLVARPNPDWSIRRVQHYLYKDMKNEEAMKELVVLDGLGEAIKKLFANRLRKQMENFADRLVGGEEEFSGAWADYVVAQKTYENARILCVVFEAKKPLKEPEPALPGSHVRVKLGGDLVRAYSVVSGNDNRFELGIALSDKSRGGSAYIHDALQVGDNLSISTITSSFPLHPAADRHVFIAGGIGITAFIAAAKQCEEKGWLYHLHYLIRNTADMSFKRYLSELGDNCTIHDKSINQICDVEKILRKTDSLTHVYCCGSQRLMDDVKQKAKANGMNDENLHFEAFEVDASGDPFAACLQKSQKTVKVRGTQTLLDVLRDSGFEVPSSCEVGNCGTCRVSVLKGRVEHRGTGLEDWDKSNAMLSCVSRGIGEIVLDI